MLSWIIICSVFGLYLLVIVAFFYLQERMIFFPEPLPDNYHYEFNGEFEEFNLQVRPGVIINAVKFKVDKPKGVILYHHGNSRNLAYWGEKSFDFTSRGFDVVMYDYRTFGKSKGRLSELGMHRDAKAMYRLLKKSYSKKRIIQYGVSLGSGVATKLARKVNAPLLILETPYYSMLAMAGKVAPYLPNRLILKYPIRTDYWIRRLRCPIHIFHGNRDEMIPFKQSIRLKLLNPRIRLNMIYGGEHNNLPGFAEFQEELGKVLGQFHDDNK